jgi:type III secretion protein Q
MPDSSGLQSAVAPVDLADIAPAEAAWRRSLFRRCGPQLVNVAGRPLSFWCLGEAPNREVAGTDRMAFAVSIGDAAATLFMPQPLAEEVLQAAGLERIGDEIAGMLLEHAFAGFLPGLERAVGHHLTVIRRDASMDGDLLLHLHCEREGASFDGVLALDAKLAEAFAALLDQMPRAAADLANLTVILTAAVGSAVLPQQDIDDLGPGDVILPHTPPLVAGQAWLGLGGGRPVVAADRAGRRMIVRERLYERGDTPMDTESPDTRAADGLIDDSELDELAMKLVFEVGRFEMSLGDLRTLGPGHVFSLDRDPEQSVDIVVNGRRIGSGQLVRVGERLGVKVLRLGQDG